MECQDIHQMENGEHFFENNTVRFTCHDGYKLIGYDKLDCVNINGTWQWQGASPVCERRVTAPIQPESGMAIQMNLALIDVS